MNKKASKLVYKSFEQFQAELFPRLVNEEKRGISEVDPKELGIGLANKAVNQALEASKAARLSRS